MLDSSAKPSSDPLLAPQWLRCQPPSAQQRNNNSNKLAHRRISRSACSNESEERSRSSPSIGRAAPYLDERERDFDQLPRTLSQNRVRMDPGIMHTPSGPRMEPSSVHHSHSKSARNASNPHLNEILSPESMTSGTPTRSSRLADLPSGVSSYIRRTPDSSPELPITPTFSKILYNDSTTTNAEFQDDLIQRERLRIEQSKKLIPVLSSSQSMGQRRPFKGRVNSSGSLIPLQGGGAISPVLKKDPKSLTLHSSHQKKVKTRHKSDGFVNSRLGQDRDDFYRSLCNNNPVSGRGGGGGDDRTPDFSPLLNQANSEIQPTSATLDSSNSSIASPDLETALNSAFEDDQGVPPSLEEELWLRQLGWNGCPEAIVLTDEEIAEFKAETIRRNVIRDRKKEEQQQGNSKKEIKSKIEQFRSYQDSPIGHLCSYDLTVDDEDGLSDLKPT